MKKVTILLEGKNAEQAADVLMGWLTQNGQDIFMDVLEDEGIDTLTTISNPEKHTLAMNIGKFVVDAKVIPIRRVG